MVIIANFFAAIAEVIHLVLMIYMWIIIIRAIMSWINPNPYHQLVQFIYQITDPVLNMVRRYIPPIAGLDLSPIIVILVIMFIDRFFVSTLRYLAIQ